MLQVFEHLGRAANHHAVVRGVKRRHAQIGKQLAALNGVGQAALVFEGLAGHGGVVQELIAHHFAQKLVLGQLLGEVVVISQFFDFAHTVNQHDFFKTLIGFGVAQHAQKGCHTGARREHVEVFAGQQIVDQQGACGFASDHNFVADLDVLKSRGERAVWHFDAQKLQMFFVVWTHDAVGAQQGFAVVAAQANHGEVAVGKTQSLVARGGKAEQAVCPVMNR